MSEHEARCHAGQRYLEGGGAMGTPLRSGIEPCTCKQAMSREPVAVISADDFAELDDAKFGRKVYAYVRGQGGYQQWLHGVDAEGEPTTEKLFVPLYAEPPELGELVAALQDIAEDGCALKSFGLPASVLEETCTCPRHRARAALAKYEDKGGRVQ